MKFSIRFSILSIILSLLISISLAIIGIYQYTVSNILVEAAKTSLKYASEQVSQEILKYFFPLDKLSLVGAGLIQNNNDASESTPSEIANFLYTIVASYEDIHTSFFATASGNFYAFHKHADNIHYSLRTMINDPSGLKATEKHYESGYQRDISVYNHGNIKHISTTPITTYITDIRSKSWYKQAVANKKHTWDVYPEGVTNDGHAHLVMASLYPIYKSNGELTGIFGVSMPLGNIHDFIRNIKLTPNSFIFICNKKQEVLSAYSKEIDLTEHFVMPSLSDLGLPQIKASHDLYIKNNQSLFLSNFNGKKYISVYRPLSEDTDLWNLGIVVPIDDITAPLGASILYTLLALAIILAIGITLATIFSTSLSKSIVKLSKDAELFCKFKFEEMKNITSRIAEVVLIIDAFVKMKAALNSFKRYMPYALVKNLILSGKIAEVGGESKRLTILFSDIENFTLLSEKMSPSDLMHYLSDYFEVVTKIIISNGGTVDKYMGDGVLAFWGAPIDDSEHAMHCCKTALELQIAFNTLNSKWRAEGKPELITRIGINTGEVIVGNVGSEDRLNYTAIGDSVNLASRLESLNKIYGTYIMVSEFTYNIIRDSFKFRLVDKVKVKGKTKELYVYELLSDDGISVENIRLFKDAFMKYESGNWQKALEIFKHLETKYPNDKLTKVFIDRCTQFVNTPPSFWDGYWVMGEK